MSLQCLLLLCSLPVALASRVQLSHATKGNASDHASQARRAQAHVETLELEDFLPRALMRAAKAAPFAMASMTPGAPGIAPVVQRGFRSTAPTMQWNYQPWTAATRSVGPSVPLGSEMGPFSGGRRVFSRYAAVNALPEQRRSILIEKDSGSYSALFNEDTKTSDAVYYTVDPLNFERGGGRGTGWATSEDLSDVMKQDDEFAAVHAKNSYLGVGELDLDRGHQAPVAAFNGNMESAQSTNQAENLTPQNAKLNQGNWRVLEEAERRVATAEAKKLHILTGPLYNLPQQAIADAADEWDELLQKWCASGVSVDCEDTEGLSSSHLNDVELRFHGKQGEGIRIPLGYYKVVADPEDEAVAGFIMDQTGSWWPMAGLPGVEEAHAERPEALDLTSVQLPDKFRAYDRRKSAALATRLAGKLNEGASPTGSTTKAGQHQGKRRQARQRPAGTGRER